MATPNRPKRVVVIDADNPMVEVQGEFFWREDHEALVAVAREEAYRTGYEAGWVEATRQAGPQVIEFRRRRSGFARLQQAVVVLVLLAVVLFILATLSAQLTR